MQYVCFAIASSHNPTALLLNLIWDTYYFEESNFASIKKRDKELWSSQQVVEKRVSKANAIQDNIYSQILFPEEK